MIIRIFYENLKKIDYHTLISTTSSLYLQKKYKMVNKNMVNVQIIQIIL